MDISRVVSDVGALTVKYPAKAESAKQETNTAKGNEDAVVERIESPQKQVAKIVMSAEELVKQKDSTESSPKEPIIIKTPNKGVKVDEYV